MGVLLLASNANGDASAPELAALEEIFTTLAGADWTDDTNWLSGDPCLNSWSGVTCDVTNTMIT